MNRRSATEQEFIRKLTEITEANLKNEQFGVSELANAMDMSRSNLYFKVKSVTNKSVSCFIREVRLKKAKELLKQTTLTVSEIAYEVGFGSPTYFIKCFHDYYGFPPGEVEKAVTHDDNSVATPQTQEPTLPKSKRKSKLITVVVLLLILSAVSIIVLNPFSSPKEIRDRSIAVLPFKNLSADKGNQYFADGIMEDIVHSLSLISGFRVISVTSTIQYRNTTKSLPEIARELGVSYIVEGSVQRVENAVKIAIQFNDAPKNKLMWSASYTKELQDIFTLQSTIALQIAEKLETILTPQEEEQIRKRYTDSTEAYDLYLEGLFYLRSISKQSDEKSLACFEKALAIDSNFCLAYNGIASVYNGYGWFKKYPKEEAKSKMKVYALKALSICPDLAEAHVILGHIAMYYDYDWDTAEKELKLAIKLQPNNAFAYRQIAEYLCITGKKDELREYINKSLELDPTSLGSVYMNYLFYRNEGNWEKSLDESLKMYDVEKISEDFYLRNFVIYMEQRKYVDAINEYKKLIAQITPDKRYDFLWNPASDVQNTIRKIIEIESTRVIESYLIKFNALPYQIAKYYAILGDKETALNYLEESFQDGDVCIAWMNYEQPFKILRKEPRFIALLKKMNLTDEQLKQVSY